MQTLNLVGQDFLDRKKPMEIENESGQSTVEFILTFAFGVSFILLIFTTSLNYATGYLVHYATFMASRTYLTADSHIGGIGGTQASLNNTEQKARQVYNDFRLSVFGVPDGNFNINPAGSTSPETYLTVGAYTTFELKLDIMGRIAGNQRLEMVSESFLGKEPTRAVCATRTCFAITGGEACDGTFDITLYDDGC